MSERIDVLAVLEKAKRGFSLPVKLSPAKPWKEVVDEQDF